ncbi:HAD-IA family hydrolase [Lederbergia citrisecunda]|uniref:HAD-IA family hydrolase n=1 Tax=Lederbergia citrisecunda TaxID=2833583 RepID=UPI0022787A67|nr:HAD-IA family hydrolase [Lederbergia citrisecunda]
MGDGEQVLMEGALDVCQRLPATHRLFIVTNGITSTQIKRLNTSDLYDYFEDIFGSQSIEFQKPSPKFFDYLMDHI